MIRRLLTLTLALVAVAVTVAPGASQAAFPGKNGGIVFSSHRDGNAEIYSINPDGSGLKRLTNDPAVDTDPAVSPNGMRIAFRSDRYGSCSVNSDIFVMDSDGSNVKRLTFDPTAQDWGPTWSPDGSKIAFVSARDGNWEIYVMNADGSNQTRMTDNAWPDKDPAWSPDGRLAWRSYDGIRVEGAGYITKDTGDEQPTWSPDGEWITFSSTRDGLPDLYSMRATGEGEVVRLTYTPDASETHPAWSPDGNMLVFERAYATSYPTDGPPIEHGHSDYELYLIGSYTATWRLASFPGDDGFADWGRLPLALNHDLVITEPVWLDSTRG